MNQAKTNMEYEALETMLQNIESDINQYSNLAEDFQSSNYLEFLTRRGLNDTAKYLLIATDALERVQRIIDEALNAYDELNYE